MKSLTIALLALLIGFLLMPPASHAASPTPASGSTRPLDGQSPGEQFESTRPSMRIAASTVKDTAHHQVLLFGGLACARGACNYLHDTWTWDGRTWTEQHPPASPSARAAASMVYDAATQEILLFGGVNCLTDSSDSCTDLGDTWTWDGQAWTQQNASPAPSPRTGASMAFDLAHEQVVLFGGIACEAESCTYFDDTWTWDGQTWALQRPPASPSGRTAAALTYDAGSQRIVLVGGRDCPDPPGGDPCHVLDDAWLWDGSAWTSIVPALAAP